MNPFEKLSSFTRPGFIGRVLLVLAALVSLYLASISLTQTSIIGCGPESGCFSVLDSRWAYLFGIPASFPAIAVYLVAVLAAGAFEARELRTWLGLAGEVTMLLITVAAIWYLSLQFFALGQFCPWCCLIHLLALTGVLFLTWSRRLQPLPDETEADWAEAPMLRRNSLMRIAHVVAVSTGIVTLGAGPFLGAPPRSMQTATANHPVALVNNGHTANQLSFLDGKILVNPRELPSIGDPEARKYAVALVDYTCDYCRLYHNILEEITKMRGDGFAVTLLPASRDDDSARVQHIMLCLFRADPAKHLMLASQLIAGTHPPLSEATRMSAVGLLGQEAWQKAETEFGPWAEQQIQLVRQLRKANQAVTGSARLPQLMAGNKILVGYYDDLLKLNEFIDQGLAPDPAVLASQLNGLSSGPQPKLVTSKNFVDLGLVEPGARVPCQVEISNAGDEPLNIQFVSLEHGCELASIPEEGLTKGGKGLISLIVTIPSDELTFQRTIKIHSNASNVANVLVQGRVAQPETQVRSALPAPTNP